MPRIHFQFAIVLTAIVAGLLTACRRTPDFSTVGGGGSASSDGWWFSSGNIFLYLNEPGTLFGMQKTPGGNREFAYFVLFRHAVGDGATFQHTNNQSFSGMVASMRDSVTIKGKSFVLALELEADKNTSTIRSRNFTINGKDVDPAKGRLFLVDLTSDLVTCQQVSATLPNDLPDPKETATVTKLARDVTKKLHSENTSVQEFLRK